MCTFLNLFLPPSAKEFDGALPRNVYLVVFLAQGGVFGRPHKVERLLDTHLIDIAYYCTLQCHSRVYHLKGHWFYISGA